MPDLSQLEINGAVYDVRDPTKAPSGYGLGETSGMQTLTNWVGINDVATKPGWYKVALSLNGISGWTLRVDTDGTNIFQVYKAIYNGNEVVMHRHKTDGGWGEFEWDNPPMVVDVEYRTTERFLGSPVYTKLIDFKGAVNGKEVETGINNVFRSAGLIGLTPIPYMGANKQDGDYSVWVQIDAGKVTLYEKGFDGYSTYLQLWYIK